MIIRFMVVMAMLSLSVIVVACGSDSATSGSENTGSSSTSSEGKLSANNASEEELEAAFEAAGITNASQWAHEVEEYHPYPVDDVNFTKLRNDLAEYNPEPGVVDAIIELLELP